jgi:membrane protein implicated in regulation of membrane protease activity
MSAPAVWWLLTFALVALELATGTIYALLVAIGFAVGALAAHLGASEPVQVVCAAVASVAFVGAWYVRNKGRPKARLADAQLDVGARVLVPAWREDRTAEVRYRGATWQARPVEGAPAVAGQHRIVDVQGNVLIVEALP